MLAGLFAGLFLVNSLEFHSLISPEKSALLENIRNFFLTFVGLP